MDKKKKTPALVTTLVLTFITALFWIFFTIYESLTRQPDPVVSRDTLLPLNPKIDTETLNLINSRGYLDTISETVIETPLAQEAPTEEVQTIESTPQATSEASLEGQ